MREVELALSRPGSDSGSIALRGMLLAYIAALIGADAAAIAFSVEVSLACYAALLFVILTQLALFSSEAPEGQAALTGLALVATLKIGAVALPQRLVPEVYWDAFPAALALIVVIALVRLGPASPGALRPPRSLHRGEWWPQLVIAAAGPAIAVAAAYVLVTVDSSLASPMLVSRPPSVLIVAAFSGLMLEVVFRGILQPSLACSFGPLAVVLASVLYAGLFLSTGSVFLVVLGLVTGLAWGLFAATTGTSRGVAVSHALYALTWTVLR